MLYFTLITIAFFILLLYLESAKISFRRNNLKHVVHVNGTRGKSSVAEYIAAGMRDAGFSVLTKITGVKPTLIHQGAERKIIKRINGARIQEQFNVLKYAAAVKAENLVLECMSINPEYQKVETSFLKPDIYVITNIRCDHKEEMGSNIEEQAFAMCDAIPWSCTVITCEKAYFGTIKSIAEKRNSRAFLVEGSCIQPVKDGTVFNENIALAVEVCAMFNIDRAQAEESILKYAHSAPPLVKTFDKGNYKAVIVDAFAANDVQSAQIIYNSCGEEFLRRIIVFNSRSDRPLRSKEFAEWIGSIKNCHKVIVTGDNKGYSTRALKNSRVKKENIINCNALQAVDYIKANIDAEEENMLVFLVGNIAGEGFVIREAVFGRINEEQIRL